MNISYSHFSEKASPFCKNFRNFWKNFRLGWKLLGRVGFWCGGVVR
nr:MAG TPA: hypothetical protein [Podoviridae sp. ctgHy19]